MIIVVEGPDNAGKTTLAQQIAKDLKAVLIKVERPKRAIDLVAYQGLLHKAAEYSGAVVADRHVAISEPIYGTIIRGGHELKPEDIMLCMAELDVVIYCRPFRDKIIGSIRSRPQMDGVVENTRAIIDAYDEFFNPAGWDHRAKLAVFNYEHQKTEDLIQSLKNHQAQEN
jgi:cytidylate kinase